jgi:polysaccharide deacetylase 2 family uncharacterized protein YibQ
MEFRMQQTRTMARKLRVLCVHRHLFLNSLNTKQLSILTQVLQGPTHARFHGNMIILGHREFGRTFDKSVTKTECLNESKKRILLSILSGFLGLLICTQWGYSDLTINP